MNRKVNTCLVALMMVSTYGYTQPAGVDTTHRPQLVRAEKDNSYLLSARKGSAGGPAIKYMPEWQAFGWFTAEDSVSWDVEVKQPGKFDVYLTWSVSDEEAGKDYLFTVGDNQLTGKVGRSGSWETFKTEKIGTLDLPAGKHKAVFKPREKFQGEALLDLKELRLSPR